MKTLFLSILLLPAYCFGQTPLAAPAVPIPSFQPKFAQFGTNQLTSINTSLESKKNKNFVIDYKSLLAGTDLKNAEEHDLNLKYGIKTLFGGVLSTNFSNTRVYGQQKENEFIGMSYSIIKPYSNLNISVKSSDTLQTQYKGMSTQIIQFDYKAKF
jgi:hypothetical protein